MATSGIERRIERLERQAEATKPIELGPLRPQITKEEWLDLIKENGHITMDDARRVVQQRTTKEATA